MTNDICKRINQANAAQKHRIDRALRSTSGKPLTPVRLACTRCGAGVLYTGIGKRNLCDPCVHEKIKLAALNRQMVRKASEPSLSARLRSAVSAFITALKAPAPAVPTVPAAPAAVCSGGVCTTTYRPTAKV